MELEFLFQRLGNCIGTGIAGRIATRECCFPPRRITYFSSGDYVWFDLCSVGLMVATLGQRQLLARISGRFGLVFLVGLFLLFT
jgi:hypothetical protein